MASLSTDQGSPETMTSRASIISANEITDDTITTLSSTLAPESHVATQSLTGGAHVTRIYSKSPHYLPLACLALCLNPPLGVPAFVCAILSRKYRVTGQEYRSTRCSQWALWLSLVAIASSIVIIIFTIVYFQVITPNIIYKIEGLAGEDGQSEPEPDPVPVLVPTPSVTVFYLENTTMTLAMPP